MVKFAKKPKGPPHEIFRKMGQKNFFRGNTLERFKMISNERKTSKSGSKMDFLAKICSYKIPNFEISLRPFFDEKPIFYPDYDVFRSLLTILNLSRVFPQKKFF